MRRELPIERSVACDSSILDCDYGTALMFCVRCWEYTPACPGQSARPGEWRRTARMLIEHGAVATEKAGLDGDTSLREAANKLQVCRRKKCNSRLKLAGDIALHDAAKIAKTLLKMGITGGRYGDP